MFHQRYGMEGEFAPNYGWSTPLYFYVRPSSHRLLPIPSGPVSTIHDNPGNRSNAEVEILGSVDGTTAAPVPGRPGSFSSEAPCAVRYERFFVGTRAQFLDNERRRDIREYLERNPVKCTSRATD